MCGVEVVGIQDRGVASRECLWREVPGRVAVAVGWEVLNFAMRSWGLQSKEDLSEWIHNQGFPVLGGEHSSVAGYRSESGTP